MTTATDPITERVARLEGVYEHLATKADLAQMELRLTQEMTQMESRMTQETSRLTQEMTQLETRMVQQMAQMESRLTWRMIGAMVGMSGAIITAVGLIVRFF